MEKNIYIYGDQQKEEEISFDSAFLPLTEYFIAFLRTYLTQDTIIDRRFLTFFFAVLSDTQIDQIPLGASVEINITVQLDRESTLSVGRHFLTIPTFTMYEQRMANGATKMFVGSVEPVTVNFTVTEGKIMISFAVIALIVK